MCNSSIFAYSPLVSHMAKSGKEPCNEGETTASRAPGVSATAHQTFNTPRALPGTTTPPSITGTDCRQCQRIWVYYSQCVLKVFHTQHHWRVFSRERAAKRVRLQNQTVEDTKNPTYSHNRCTRNSFTGTCNCCAYFH